MLPTLQARFARARPVYRIAATALLVALGYYIGANLGFILRFPPATPSLIWPPNSILTATLLLGRYRTRRPHHRLEAIPAGESRGILEAIAGADWTQMDRVTGAVAPMALYPAPRKASTRALARSTVGDMINTLGWPVWLSASASNGTTRS